MFQKKEYLMTKKIILHMWRGNKQIIELYFGSCKGHMKDKRITPVYPQPEEETSRGRQIVEIKIAASW